MKKKELKYMEELNKNTEKLASQLERLGIKKFYLTGAGNSLMSGYSTIFKTAPLFKRNTNLTAIFAKHDIDVIATHFARSQNNNDEHIYHYFHTNISEQEMYRYNRIDNLKPDTPVVGMTEEEIAEYYPENPILNHRFKDSVLTKEKDRANILVYIGATGSFLDNITRGGFPKIISGFKRDFTSISATLKDIQSSNRHDGTNTEVYLVGIPRYMGTPVTDILINRHLKDIAENYANVTYVEPIKAKLFYGLNSDVHLNEEEYLDLNNSIMESIDDNYIVVMAKIEIDRFLFNLNEIIETFTLEIVGNAEVNKIAFMHGVAKKRLNETLNPIIDKYLSMMEAENKDTQKFLEDITAYINERLPYDFYYLGKENLNTAIKKYGKTRTS